MANVHDVAAYLVERQPMTAMKLEKLVYYGQAWHLVWHGNSLFTEPIEAWANGPVVRDLYNEHRGLFSVAAWPKGDATALSADEAGTLDVVLATYGQKSAQWLSEQTHSEGPWRFARRGVPPGLRSNATIEVGAIRNFYASEQAARRGPEAAILRP